MKYEEALAWVHSLPRLAQRPGCLFGAARCGGASPLYCLSYRKTGGLRQ